MKGFYSLFCHSCARATITCSVRSSPLRSLVKEQTLECIYVVQASRWCQTTINFLDDMFLQSEMVKKSEEASALVSKVTTRVTDSVDQQEAKIDQVGVVSVAGSE